MTTPSGKRKRPHSYAAVFWIAAGCLSLGWHAFWILRPARETPRSAPPAPSPVRVQFFDRPRGETDPRTPILFTLMPSAFSSEPGAPDASPARPTLEPPPLPRLTAPPPAPPDPLAQRRPLSPAWDPAAPVPASRLEVSPPAAPSTPGIRLETVWSANGSVLSIPELPAALLTGRPWDALVRIHFDHDGFPAHALIEAPELPDDLRLLLRRAAHGWRAAGEGQAVLRLRHDGGIARTVREPR